MPFQKSLETQAKIQIQGMIRNGELELVSSYVLLYENSNNPHILRQNAIRSFVKDYANKAFGSHGFHKGMGGAGW